MGGKKHNYNAWEERTISEVNVQFHLRSCSGNSLLAAVGKENSEGRMTYVVAKEYLDAFGSNATINAYTRWRKRDDVVQWLISLVRNDDSPPALSGHFPSSEDSNRVELYCGISMKTFSYLCSLVMEPMSNSRKYKFNDNRELTVIDKVTIAMRRLKFGKSLKSIGDEMGTHSFTADKVTRSFVEALVVNGLHHLHRPATATEEGMSAETLDRLKEEWKVLDTVMKCDKRPSMTKACSILHNIVIDMNDERHREISLLQGHHPDFITHQF